MTKDFSYVALLDVLSYRSRLNDDIQKGNLNFKNDLQESLSIFDNINHTYINVRAISDTIILTCPDHDLVYDFLIFIKKVYIKFLEQNLFIRGGISYSKHFHNERITYSHALALAYELERSKAIYPRVILDENIIEMHKISNFGNKIFGKNLIAKQNNTYFLNIIDEENIQKIHNLAANIYEIDKDKLYNNESAFSKHQWFENYIFTSPTQHHLNRYIPKISVM